MLVTRLASIAGVTPETVRHYTRKGLLLAQKDPDNGYHLYDDAALVRLRFIKQARALGFSLNEITSIIDEAEGGVSPCPSVRALLAKKIPETKAQIALLSAHLQVMESAMNEWQHLPDGAPTGESVCCLIESWSDVEQDNG